jgi:DnaJ-class molecular chaperone
VPTTLKEFYNGCIKTISYQKQIICLDGKSVQTTTANKKIEIKPGMDQANTFTFASEGNQSPG